MTTTTQPPQTKIQQWEELKNYINKYFMGVDLEGYLICLSTYAAHFYLSEKPIWLFLLGDSGAGKSTIAIKSLEWLRQVYPLTDITPNTFLSGLGKEFGLLPLMNKKSKGNGFITFSDFSSVLDERPDVRGKIVAVFRRLADGSYEKNTGAQEDEELKWKGKISAIAACTFELERRWSLNRSLGERFLSLKWRASRDISGILDFKIRHTGKEKEIEDGFRKLVQKFVNWEDFKKVEVEELIKSLYELKPLAILISKMRANVIREYIGSKRVVVDVTAPEIPTRIIGAMAGVARGCATLFGRNKCTEFDLALSRRLGADSIPTVRYRFMRILVESEGRELKLRDLKARLGMPRTTFNRLVEDMSFLGLVEVMEIGDEKVAVVEESTEDLWVQAFGSNPKVVV